MNVLLAGAGPMALGYAKVLQAMGVSFSAVGRGAGSAKAFADGCGVAPATGGLDAWLAANRPSPETLAIVALPIPDLAAATCRLAEAGVRRILVEKPAGLNAREIESVEQTAARTGAEIYVGYNRRFFASVQAARHLIVEDGGATSFQFEFTEIESRVLAVHHNKDVLANWFLANSTHVVDAAFFLGGEPAELSATASGALAWHPAGAVFVGHGRTAAGALFSWHADWSSAGRWGIDIRTRKRRLILQPLEQLSVQDKGSFAITPHAIDDSLDKQFKPGLYRQVAAALSPDPVAAGLPTIAQQAQAAGYWYGEICPASAASWSTGFEAIRHVR
jgi:predicted dehydrogenase